MKFLVKTVSILSSSTKLSDFNSAIKLDPNNAMAFCNRGLAKIKLNDKNGGCLDLSKAGELGFQAAYESIKKYCN